MIIRAVSDDDDDGDDGAHPLTPQRTSGRARAAKLAWLGASLALAVLLLVDLAAVMSHFQDPSGEMPATTTRDSFALLPVLMDAWTSSPSSSSSSGMVVVPATALNNLLGYVIVGAWIYSRETNVRRDTRGGSSGICSIRSPWTLVAGVLCFGHVVSCAYILAALFESDGDRGRFFLGKARAGRTYPRI